MFKLFLNLLDQLFSPHNIYIEQEVSTDENKSKTHPRRPEVRGVGKWKQRRRLVYTTNETMCKIAPSVSQNILTAAEIAAHDTGIDLQLPRMIRRQQYALFQLSSSINFLRSLEKSPFIPYLDYLVNSSEQRFSGR